MNPLRCWRIVHEHGLYQSQPVVKIVRHRPRGRARNGRFHATKLARTVTALKFDISAIHLIVTAEERANPCRSGWQTRCRRTRDVKHGFDGLGRMNAQDHGRVP